MWSFAATILYLATGGYPYAGFSEGQMLAARIFRKPPTVPDSVPDWLMQVLKQCLRFDTAQRPPVSQLLQVDLKPEYAVIWCRATV